MTSISYSKAQALIFCQLQSIQLASSVHELDKLLQSDAGHVDRESRKETEETCGESERQPAKTDPIMAAYRQRSECIDKNIMVCKSCRVDFILNQTLRVSEGEFEVFCMDGGDFTRISSPLLVVSTSTAASSSQLCKTKSYDSSCHEVQHFQSISSSVRDCRA